MDSPILFKLFEGIKPDRKAEKPVYLQLSDGIINLIKNGKLHAGQKIPGSRDLAAILGLNRVMVCL